MTYQSKEENITSDQLISKSRKKNKGINYKKPVSYNLGNQPISKQSLYDLPLGFHIHPYANRSQRRQKTKESNNRKVTLGRAKKKYIEFTKEGVRLSKILSDSKSTESQVRGAKELALNNIGNLKRSMFKTMIVDTKPLPNIISPLE